MRGVSRWLTHYGEAPRGGPFTRHIGRCARGLHAGLSREPFDDVVHKCDLTFGDGIPASRKLDFGCEDALGSKARIDVLEVPEALDQQGRACQEDQSDRYLKCGEAILETAVQSRARPAPTFPQKSCQFDTRGLPRGQHAKHESRRNRRSGTESQHATIHADTGKAWERGGRERAKCVDTDDGNTDAEDARTRTKAHRLGQQLAHESTACCAKRGANRHLTLAS